MVSILMAAPLSPRFAARRRVGGNRRSNSTPPASSSLTKMMMIILCGLLLTKAVSASATASSSAATNMSSSSSSSTLTYRNVYIDSLGNTINASQRFSFGRDEVEEQERRARMQERRRRAREYLQRNPPPQPAKEQLEKLTDEQLRRAGRNLGWFGGGGSSTDLYSSGFLADSSQSYDKWAQAYRMLGAMIDCDHVKQEGSHDNKNNNNQQSQTCSRWMLWAAYVNPNYQGNGYDEYYGEEPVSALDCHNPSSDWVLLGVYRQEFYQFIEQISKHLWAYSDYEYVVAVAGLKYMTDSDCFQVGSSSSGDAVYAGVMPLAYGKWQMGLYSDSLCIQPDNSGKTYDDYVSGSNVQFGGGSHDNKNGDDDAYNWAKEWWTSSQEYTLTNLNEVYEEYKYCTTCVDYPTYQDGYFIGNDGTDDDDLINQCWKFYSHDSYTCEAECIAKAHAQGTILFVDYGEVEFGKTLNSFYTVTNKADGISESPLQRLLANAALTASFLLFVATFLAFAVARRSRFREARSARSRRLLDDDDEARSRRSKRSSRSAGGGGLEPAGDGLFRVERSSKSPSKKSSSHRSSKTRSSSAHKSSSRKHKSRSRSYEPPTDHRPRSERRGGGGGEGSGGGGEEYH